MLHIENHLNNQNMADNLKNLFVKVQYKPNIYSTNNN